MCFLSCFFVCFVCVFVCFFWQCFGAGCARFLVLVSFGFLGFGFCFFLFAWLVSWVWGLCVRGLVWLVFSFWFWVWVFGFGFFGVRGWFSRVLLQKKIFFPVSCLNPNGFVALDGKKKYFFHPPLPPMVF